VEQGEENTRNFRRLQWSRVQKSGHFLRLHTGRVRANQDSLQDIHRQGANSLQAALRRGANLPGKGESEGVEFLIG